MLRKNKTNKKTKQKNKTKQNKTKNKTKQKQTKTKTKTNTHKKQNKNKQTKQKKQTKTKTKIKTKTKTKTNKKKKRFVASTTYHDTTYSYNMKPTTIIIKSRDINLAGVNPVKLGKILNDIITNIRKVSRERVGLAVECFNAIVRLNRCWQLLHWGRGQSSVNIQSGNPFLSSILYWVMYQAAGFATNIQAGKDL